MSNKIIAETGIALAGFAAALAASTHVDHADNHIPLALFALFACIAVASVIRVGLHIEQLMPPATGPQAGEPDLPRHTTAPRSAPQPVD